MLQQECAPCQHDAGLVTPSTRFGDSCRAPVGLLRGCGRQETETP
jgi:hypothetical protein